MSNRTSAIESSKAPILVEAALVVAILVTYLALVAPTLGRPLLENHAFRQTQTAYTARIYHEQGIDLLHPRLPVLGEPFEVPFEFPLFQAAASIAMDLGMRDDPAMRTTCLLCFVATALLLFGLVRQVAGRVSAIAALGAFVLTPFSLVWGRASMMEYLATAGGVGFAWSTIAWRESGRRLPGALALLAGLIGMLVKPTTAIFWVAPALSYRPNRPKRDVARRRRDVGWTATLVALPIGAALVWTRHADVIKAASPTTDWLTSSALQGWNFGSLGQRFDLGTWDVILSRVALTVLGAAGIVMLVAAAIATISSTQRRFWLTMWLGAILPPLVFTNLYFQHDYYLAAISPALAALVGFGVGYLWERLPQRQFVAAGAVAVAVALGYTTLDVGRSYWLRIHGSKDDAQVMPLARQISAHTGETDLIGIAGLDWSPAVLYYARRWGHMAVRATEDSTAYDLMHEHGYDYFLSADPQRGDLERLSRWRYVGALDRNLYALADRPATLAGWLTVATDETVESGRSMKRRLRLRCGRPVSIRSGARGTWIALAPSQPRAQLTVSPELAPLPVRRAVYVARTLAPGGRLTLACTGVPSLRILGVRHVGGPAGS